MPGIEGLRNIYQELPRSLELNLNTNKEIGLPGVNKFQFIHKQTEDGIRLEAGFSGDPHPGLLGIEIKKANFEITQNGSTIDWLSTLTVEGAPNSIIKFIQEDPDSDILGSISFTNSKGTVETPFAIEGDVLEILREDLTPESRQNMAQWLGGWINFQMDLLKVMVDRAKIIQNSRRSSNLN